MAPKGSHEKRKKMISLCPSSSDRISGLPSDVLRNILSRLPIQEAARTSILSKKWRDEWRYLSRLDFYDLDWSSNFFVDVFKILLLHRGPIQEFKANIPSMEANHENHMHSLIRFLCEKEVQSLSLCAHCWDDDDSHFYLPPPLFSRSQLRHLVLTYCEFDIPPTLEGFSKMVHLEFHKVEFDPNIFLSFISKCPSLERLTITESTPFDSLDFDATKLKSLSFFGEFNRISFKNTPLLAEACVAIDECVGQWDVSSEASEECTWVEIFDCLPAIERLSVDYLFRIPPVGNLTNRLQRNVDHLRILELPIYFGMIEEVKSLLSLLLSSLKLQKLKIEVAESVDYDEVNVPSVKKFLESQDLRDYSLNQLREVKMKLRDNYHRGMPEFIRFLLAKSMVLEKIVFDAGSVFDGDRGDRTLRDMLRFPRASPRAEIIIPRRFRQR